VDNPGKVLVQGRLLAEIVGKLPAETVSLSLADNRLGLTSGSSKFALSAMSTSDYPSVPEFPTTNGSVSAADFAHAVAQVAVAASKEEITPVLTGVMLSADAKQITLVATDRFRVAVKNLPWKGNASERELLIPARVIGEIARTFAGSGDLEIAFASGDKEMIGFKSGNKSVTSATIKGKYPAVLSLFPDSVTNSAVVNTHDLLDATKRVALVVDREKPLRYNFKEGELSLESVGGEIAEGSEQVQIALTGEEVTVSLRPQFLSDALVGIESDMVRIGFTQNPNNPNKPGPVLITEQSEKGGAADFRYLLQPNLLVQ
jgi:DNA polymerase-3 subunit beta